MKTKLETFLKKLAESYSGKIPLSVVRELCPTCAELMESKKITAISVRDFLNSKRLKEQGFNQGLCNKFGGDEGFFTRCADAMAGEVDDASAFCAELHNFCVGKYPSQESQRMQEDMAAMMGMMMDAGSPEAMKKMCMEKMGDNPNAETLCSALMEKISAKLEAKEPMRESVHFDAHLIESKDEGKTWEVVLIEAGVSKNGVHYSEDLLKRSAPMFDGAKAYAYEFKGDMGTLLDHMPDDVRTKLPKGTAKNLVGDYSDTRFGEFTRPDGTKGKGIVAKFHVAASWLRDLAANAWKMGRKNLFGFSIDALADVKEKIIEGVGKVKDVLNFQKLDEVTVVSSPGAGGVLLNLVESNTKRLKENANMEKLWQYIKENFPKYLEGITIDETKLSESADVLLGIMEKIKTDLAAKASAAATSPPPPATAPAGANTVTADQIQQMITEALKVRRDAEEKEKASRNFLEKKLKESNLPEAVQQEIKDVYADSVLDEAGVNRIIARKQATLDQLVGQGANFPGQTRESAVSVTKDQEDKWGDALEGMLTGKAVKDVRPFHSLHESYTRITGRHGNAGQMGAWIMNELAHATPAPISLYLKESYGEVMDDHRARLRESRLSMSTRVQENSLQTSTWAEIFGDRLYKAMLKSYANQDFSDWRKIVSNIASVPDFKTQRRQRMGGFADLSTVAELGTYTEFTWPADEEVSYSVSKYGNLAPLSMEALINDDLGALRQIPAKIGLAAARTLYKFVFDFVEDNPTMDYDSVALFHASHGNLGSTALSDAALDDRIFAMADQTELSSGEVLMNLRPKFILHPNELERTAWEVANSTYSHTSGRTETVEQWLKTFGLEPIRVPYWSDATDWAIMADPNQWDTIEIAFLNGRQEPEIFLQDAPTVGSVFTADRLTYKVRFIFGGDVLDHRAFDKSVVGG